MQAPQFLAVAMTFAEADTRAHLAAWMKMVYQFIISPEQSESLDRAAAALRLPREWMISVAEEYGWSAHPESAAAQDRRSAELPDSVRGRVAELPRVVASIYLRTGADHLAGLAALFGEREVFRSPGVLARAAFENAVRAVWILAPFGDPSGAEGASRRVSRAMLEELASAHFSRQAIVHLADRTSDGYRLVKSRSDVLKSLAEATFGREQVSLTDDPYRWRISDQGYPRITGVAEAWTAWRDDELPARGIYDYLSLFGHPQGLAGRDDLNLRDPEQPTRTSQSVDLSTLGKLAMAGFASWVDGFGLLTSYHGIPHDEDGSMARAAAALDELQATVAQ